MFACLCSVYSAQMCVQFVLRFISFVHVISWMSHSKQLVYMPFYYFRNSGNLYGGKLNLTHMGFYSTHDKLLNITFKESTIVRRLNVHGIQIRTMIVVSILYSLTHISVQCSCSLKWNNAVYIRYIRSINADHIFFISISNIVSRVYPVHSDI